MVRTTLEILLGANAVLFGVAAGRAAYLFATERLPLLRRLAAANAGVSALAALGAVIAVVVVAGRAGRVDPDFVEMLETPAQILGTVVAAILAVIVVRLFRSARPGLSRAERVLTATTTAPVERSVSELGLTPRELDVLEAMFDGHLTDRELAAALFVSPATAGSHVRNIMAKAGVTSRRDLLALIQPKG